MPASSPISPKTPEEIRENRSENLIAFAITLLVVGSIGYFVWHAMSATPVNPTGRSDVPVGNAPTLGNATAPVTVVVFSDFECPFCGEFARTAFPQIKQLYIDTGQVRIAYRHFPLPTHMNAFRSAEAAQCAQDQGRFWQYHDALFAHQDALDADALISYAKDLGLDEARFRTCLTQDERATDVAQDRDWGLRLGVSGTPTFFFNGRAVAGALSADEFGAQVAKEMSATD